MKQSAFMLSRLLDEFHQETRFGNRKQTLLRRCIELNEIINAKYLNDLIKQQQWEFFV